MDAATSRTAPITVNTKWNQLQLNCLATATEVVAAQAAYLGQVVEVGIEAMTVLVNRVTVHRTHMAQRPTTTTTRRGWLRIPTAGSCQKREQLDPRARYSGAGQDHRACPVRAASAHFPSDRSLGRGATSKFVPLEAAHPALPDPPTIRHSDRPHAWPGHCVSAPDRPALHTRHRVRGLPHLDLQGTIAPQFECRPRGRSMQCRLGYRTGSLSPSPLPGRCCWALASQLRQVDRVGTGKSG